MAIEPAVERCWKCTRVPVRRARARSRITMSSSASAGWPGMPRRDDHSPSCMWPPAASTGSSQCWARITPLPGRPLAYSMARRMRRASATPAPSSVKNRTPSSAISPIGASCSPARPTVMAPEVRTSHGAVRPSSSTSRTMPAWSMAGIVLGMARMHVYPPRAAPRAPDSTVSASSWPGWRRWLCRSTNPGLTTQPPASRVQSPERSGPTAAMVPSSPITTSAARSPVLSTTRPPLMAMVPISAPPPGARAR